MFLYEEAKHAAYLIHCMGFVIDDNSFLSGTGGKAYTYIALHYTNILIKVFKYYPARVAWCWAGRTSATGTRP